MWEKFKYAYRNDSIKPPVAYLSETILQVGLIRGEELTGLSKTVSDVILQYKIF